MDRAALTTRPATASYALIKVVYDNEGHDYIDNFVPFVAEVMRQAGVIALSITAVQERIQATFRLTLPQGALKIILGRAVHRGLCRAERHEYIPDLEAINRLNFQQLFDQVLEDHRSLVLSLVQFSGTRLLTPWSPEQAETALLGYITDKGPSLLAFALRVSPLVETAPVNDAAYVLNLFVQSLAQSSPDDLRKFSAVVEGSLLASGLYFPQIGGIGQRFDRLSVYLDTRVLIYALGYAGPEVQSASRELLDLLYELGAQLRCFDHTLAELRAVMTFALDALKYRSSYRTHTGEVVEYLTRSGFRPSDVETMIATLEQSLAELRIKVAPHPDHASPLTIDEAKLEASLRAGINTGATRQSDTISTLLRRSSALGRARPKDNWRPPVRYSSRPTTRSLG